MLRIGCADVDGHNWPNLCLMKLSAHHKNRGDDVEMWTPEGSYDLVYKSRVFTDTCRTWWSISARTIRYIRSFPIQPMGS